MYYSDGNFYNGKGLRGKILRPYTKGDIIVVTVDCVQGKIEWRIGGEQRLVYDYDRIRDNNIDWVPFIWI